MINSLKEKGDYSPSFSAFSSLNSSGLRRKTLISLAITSIDSRIPAETAWLIISASFWLRFLKKMLFGILEHLTDEIFKEGFVLGGRNNLDFRVTKQDRVIVELVIFAFFVLTLNVGDGQIDISQNFCFFVHFEPPYNGRTFA